MALSPNGQIIHLPFGERPQFGTPYPDGIAVGHINQTGDASGGKLTMTFLADGGFVYRFEGINMSRGTSVIEEADLITAHGWATAKSGLGTSAFDLNWILSMSLASSFAVYSLGGGRAQSSSNPAGNPTDYQQLHRLPMGRTDKVAVAQTLARVQLDNITTVTHELSMWCTYWRVESLYLPGFLSSFYEAPEVPPLVRRE